VQRRCSAQDPSLRLKNGFAQDAPEKSTMQPARGTSPSCVIGPGKRTFISPGIGPVKESFVRTRNITLAVASAILIVSVSAFGQSKPAGVVPSAELQKLVPAAYFYRGQSASVQIRNSGAIRTKDQRYVVAALVDTSGYSTDVAEKYQGLFITEVKVKIEGTELAPGEYGFGFVGDKFVVTDVGANDVFSVSSKADANLKRPVPLKVSEEGGEYRLYHGKKYVTVQTE